MDLGLWTMDFDRLALGECFGLKDTALSEPLGLPSGLEVLRAGSGAASQHSTAPSLHYCITIRILTVWILTPFKKPVNI